MSDVSSSKTVEEYCRLVGTDDLAGLLALFADGAAIEDPVGSPTKTGDELAAFYGALVGSGTRLELRGPVAGTDAHRAFLFTVHTGEDFSMDVIDVMSFDDDARITSMKAFWAMG